MYNTALTDYESALAGCRFCPMCKPAADVANVTLIESHSTRARAMMLWRWLKGIAELSPRDIEILYQSTLDNISESWCVSHFPVSAYLLAARRRVISENQAPAPVRAVLNRTTADDISGEGPALFVAGEIWELADRAPWLAATRIALDQLGVKAGMAVVGNGVIEFALGDVVLAKKRAETFARLLAGRRPQTLIADGSDTLFALTKLYPAFGIKLEDMRVVSLAEMIATAPNSVAKKLTGRKVLCHDARSAFFLSDKLATDGAIQPGFTGPEEVLGSGAVYDRLRELVRLAGGEPATGVWTRTLAKSCGSDDGLWLTYPRLAAALGNQRLDYARRLKCDTVLVDSPLAAAHLKRIAVTRPGAPEIHWTPELMP